MENQTNRKFEPSKKITRADGTIAYIFDNKLHNWEGPALIPEGNNRKREYYINGIKSFLKLKFCVYEGQFFLHLKVAI